MNYDIAPGKIQLYSMGTDKADSVGWSSSVLFLVHCSFAVQGVMPSVFRCITVSLTKFLVANNKRTTFLQKEEKTSYRNPEVNKYYNIAFVGNKKHWYSAIHNDSNGSKILRETF